MKKALVLLVFLSLFVAGTNYVKAADETMPAKPEAAKPEVAMPEAAKPEAAKPEVAMPEAAKPAAKISSAYVCEKCCTVAMQPGKCSMCGGEMQKKHLLSIKDGMASFCSCPGDCKCTTKEGDASTCSCGKPIVKASLKGMYVCGCGPECKCNTMSDKPGKCHCGEDLKKVE